MKLRMIGFLLHIWALMCRVGAFLSRLAPTALFSNRLQLNMTERKTVCVVGGGFGGLYSAMTIGRKADEQTDVYLIDPKDRFVFLPLLYELAVGTAAAIEVAPKYEKLLSGSKVKFIKGAVQNVDFNSSTCSIRSSPGAASTPESIKFDQLVIAAGIQPRSDLITGAKQHALPFYTVADAFSLKNKLPDLKRKTERGEMVRVVVIGGGYSGVEVATNIAQELNRDRSVVTVIDRNPKIMTTSPDHNRNVAQKSLSKYNVNIQYNTSVIEVHEKTIDLMGPNGASSSLPADLIVFTAGTEQSEFIKSLNVEKDSFGRVLTTPTLQSKSYPNVFALGDCSAVDGQSNPATAQVAMQQSGVVAKNVLTAIKQSRMLNSEATPPQMKEFKYVSLGEMLTLGDTNAAITSLGGYVKLSGPLAAAGRRAIYAVRMPTISQKVKAMVTASAVTTGKVWRRAFSSPRSSAK